MFNNNYFQLVHARPWLLDKVTTKNENGIYDTSESEGAITHVFKIISTEAETKDDL